MTNRFGAKKWRNQLEELERLLEHERTSKSFFANFVDLIIVIIEMFCFLLFFVAEISCIGVSRDDSLIASGGDDGKCIITKN